MKAHRLFRSTVLVSTIPFLIHRNRQGGGVVRDTVRSLYPPGKKTWYLLCKSAGWDPGPVQTSAEHFAFTGIRSTGRPGRGESL